MISDHAPSDWNIHLTVQYRNPNKQRRSNMVGWRAVVVQLGKGKELSRICPHGSRSREKGVKVGRWKGANEKRKGRQEYVATAGHNVRGDYCGSHTEKKAKPTLQIYPQHPMF